MPDLRAAIAAQLAPRLGDRDDAFVDSVVGVRTQLGANWYLRGGVEVLVTSPKAFDFQILGGLMKVF
jgi:hypothetical protein